MIPGLQDTPPEVALILGFFICQGLKRSKVNELIDFWLPTNSDEDSNE